jgi:type IV pilus assembly protein PilO
MKMDMKGISIPKRFRFPLIILLGIAIIVAGYFLQLKPQFEEKDRLAVERGKAQEELARLVTIKNSIEKTRKEYAQLKLNLDEALRQMPEEKEIPNLLRQVSLAAQESKTRIKYFAPKAVQTVDFYSELPFEIRYTAPYHNIGYFFDGIRKLERIVHVTSFSLESKGSTGKVVLEGACTAKAYVLPKQTSKEATKGTKKDEKNAPVKR